MTKPDLPLYGKQCACPTCDERFDHWKAFDAHRRSNKCINPSKIRKLNKDSKGFWSLRR